MKPRTGGATHSASCSVRSSASPFGTSSPATTWKNVRISSDRITAIAVAGIAVEDLQERVLAQSTDCQRGDGDAELHRGDEPGRLARDREHELRAPVALLPKLLHARPPHCDERVLGADEEPVQQNEGRDGDQLEKEGHAPISGA